MSRVSDAMLARLKESSGRGVSEAGPGAWRVEVMAMTDTRAWKLRRVSVSQDRSITVENLLIGWQQHIRRLHREATGVAATDAWGMDDYVAALCLRDFLASAEDDLGPAHARELAEAVRGADHLLLSFTVADPDRVVQRASGIDAGSGWWWARMPASGPVVEDMRSRGLIFE